jgi:short subunit dehydrogenase-like uncharacterized protein
VRWLIYGANGYTGALVARRAVSEGHEPVLAGRDGKAVMALAHELGLDHRAVPLTEPPKLRRLLDGVDVVAHCAGPFRATARPMVEACLATGTHYLDVTGEINVFEWIYAQHERAVAAGVVLLPGSGFDVVPTDCLAARLAAALPGATSLDLAFRVGGGPSRGTLRSSMEGLAAGGVRRIDGVLRPAPLGEPVREVQFDSGRAVVNGIRWGDLVSAYRSTGIPTITTYTSLGMSPRQIRRLSGPARRLLRVAPVRALAGALAGRRRGGPGPDGATRARTRSEVWAEVRDAGGATATATLTGPNPYDLTADAVVKAVERLRAAPGEASPAAGAHTPSTAFGADFVEALSGVRVKA